MVADPSPPRGEAALRREIGVLLGAFLVVNATIGTGIFKTPAHVARQAGSLPVALGVWLAGGVIALCGALSFAELSSAMPRAGGIYEYLRRAYGRPLAFWFGWTKLILLIPAAAGSFAKLAAEALSALFGWTANPWRESLVALGFLLACGGFNLAGVRSSATTQAIISLAKYGGVALLGLLGLGLAGAAIDVPALPDAPAFRSEPALAGFAAALIAVMWAYDGWADLSSLAGEVRRPERSLPRALAFGTLAVVGVYLLANLAYARVLGLDGLRQATTGEHMPAAWLAAATLGASGKSLLSALILTSCVGGCLSSLLTGSRVFVPLASDGLFFRWLGAVSPVSGVPARAVLASVLLGGAYLSVHSFEQLTDAFVVGYFPFYCLSVLGLFVLRRREPNLERPFRVPAFPFTPLVFLAGGLIVMGGAFAQRTPSTLLALGLMAAGLPIGLAWLRWGPARARGA